MSPKLKKPLKPPKTPSPKPSPKTKTPKTQPSSSLEDVYIYQAFVSYSSSSPDKKVNEKSLIIKSKDGKTFESELIDNGKKKKITFKMNKDNIITRDS